MVRCIRGMICTALLLQTWGCTAHTALTPAGRGRTRVEAAVGGPIVKAFGTRIPVPYLAVGVRHGFRDDLDGSASLHLLPLAYGLAGLDGGLTWYRQAHRSGAPTFSGSARLLLLGSLRSDVTDRFRAYPLFSGSAAWESGGHTWYLGSDLTLPVSGADYDPSAPRMILSPFAGIRFPVASRTDMYAELKWHGANVQTDELAVRYLPIGGHGALTLLFALAWGMGR